MKNTARIVLVILMCLTTFSFAQTPVTYDYLCISYTQKNIEISINGKDYSKEKVTLPSGTKSVFNTNPILAKIKEFEVTNWELISLNGVELNHTMVYTAFMRKPIKVQAP